MDYLRVLTHFNYGFIIMNTTSRRKKKVRKKYRFFSRSVTHDLCLKNRLYVAAAVILSS